MEKEPQPDSLSEVAIKADYPPSEMYSSEPPPAYHRHKSSAVQVAKIIAYTVVAVSFILGGFILASAYVNSNAQCKQLEQEKLMEQELQFLSDIFDKGNQPLQPEALVQDEPKAEEKVEDNKLEDVKPVKELSEAETDEEDSSSSEGNSEENDMRLGLKLKFPMQMVLNEIAQVLHEKQEKQDTNCVIEKRVNHQIFDRTNPFMRMQFGMPQQEHVTGEKIVIICKSGNDQRPEQPQEEMMPHPMLIPLPPQQFHTHMPQQMAPQFSIQAHLRPMEQGYPQIQEQENEEPQRPQQPNPLLAHIIQRIIAQRLQMEAMRGQQEPEAQQVDQNQIQFQGPSNSEMLRSSKLPIPEEILQQVDRLPHSSGVIIAVSEHDSEEPEQTKQGPEMAQEEPVEPKVMPMQFELVREVHEAPVEFSPPQQEQEKAQN